MATLKIGGIEASELQKATIRQNMSLTNLLKLDEAGLKRDDVELDIDDKERARLGIGVGGQVVTLSNVMAEQLHGNIEAQAQTATNFCYHMTVVIPADARRFRVALDNSSITLPFRIASGAIATSDSIGPDPTFGSTVNQVRFTPQNGTGWTPLTWNSVGNVEIAVASSSTLPRRVWSDWIDCPTIENIDGTNKRIVMFRFWVEGTVTSPGNGYCTSQYSQAWRVLAADTTVHGGYLYQCIRSTVNGVAVPANFTPVTDLKDKPFLTSFEYETYIPGLTLTALGGDSQMAGAVNGSDANFGKGWLWQLLLALRVKHPDTPIDLANAAVASVWTPTSSARALSYIESAGVVGLPFYQPYSQNDGTPSVELYSEAWDRYLAVASAISPRTDMLPILTTPMPNTSHAWSAEVDAIRLAARASLLALRTSGQAVIDYECVSDGGIPARYKTSWTTDNAHPNVAGHAIIKRGAISEIKLIGL